MQSHANASPRRQRSIEAALLVALVILVAVGQWRIAVHDADSSMALVRRPRGVMGTDCVLAAVAARRDAAAAEAALDAAEAALRHVEARMSNWLDDSEVSRLCTAATGTPIPLSPDTLAVLRAARDAFESTARTFDVTCRPQIELWRHAGATAQMPPEAEIAEACAASRWEDLVLTDSGVVKRTAGACVDLGGIAKGYGIDLAVQALQRAGLRGGLVDVGGDVACFGRQAGGQLWLIAVKDPAQPGSITQLHAGDRAVATSGDYARYFEIEGKRHSHIIDPRTGRPAEAARAATVVADTALVADVWATALSVLGPEGLERLPEGVEALVVGSGENGQRLVCTPGFRELCIGPLLKTSPATRSRPP